VIRRAAYAVATAFSRYEATPSSEASEGFLAFRGYESVSKSVNFDKLLRVREFDFRR
jgi:hypothetical protein